MTRMRWWALTLAVGAIACSPMTMEPTLEMTASPRVLRNDGQISTITLTAVDEKGQPGTGSVRVRSTAGNLKDGMSVTLAAGKAEVSFSCAVAMDADCRSSVRVTAEWTTSLMKLVEGTVSLTVQAPIPDAGSGGGQAGGSAAGGSAGGDAAGGAAGGSMAGGSATAGGSAGGSASMGDGGLTDGGLLVTTDKTQIIGGIGDIATLTATVTGATGPLMNQQVTWTTTLGTFPSSPDGGTSSTCTTDATGVCTQTLTAGAGTVGRADVTTSVLNASALTQIRVVSVSQLQYVSSSCAQTTMNCNLLGLRGSGFNETAIVTFRVLDPSNQPVAGVPVAFSLVGPPAGTTVDPMQISGANGEVRANVRSGLTVGTFTVRATALTFSVESPTIGVRGAKPSNQGFNLQCARINLSAYNSPVPPRALSIQCTVTLTDRYNNPIGTGTAVRLNSEAGGVPNDVTTTPFAPGSNPNEGRGSFSFQTDIGRWPPVDQPPFPADPTQYPFPRAAEPSSADGPLLHNPRDGLVTIIAYLQGEEHFSDNNANGMRDSNEQFIDQGEPLLDSNDNNVYDTNEFYVDTNANGQWDGPNGQWDATTQIWTDLRLLYTGASYAPECRVTAGSRASGSTNFGTIGSATLNLFMPDRRLNRLAQGTTLVARFQPATRGNVTLTSTAMQDEYGFRLVQRLRLDAAGTGPCSPGTAICSYFTRFGNWDEGLLGSASLTESLPPYVPTAQTLIVESTVDGITVQSTASGIVQ